MATYYGLYWKLYESFVVNKDNGLFTIQNQAVKVGLLNDTFSGDIYGQTNITDIPAGAWSIDAAASHYLGTAVMFEPVNFIERLCIMSSGKAVFTAPIGGAEAAYAVVYNSDTGALIAYLPLQQSGASISFPEGDTLQILMDTDNVIYRQDLNRCPLTGGGGE